MTTEADFIRAVCADPFDDGPRLLMADWLEERGGPGDGDRAEFIRVQCAIAAGAGRETELFNEDVDWSQCTGVAASWCPNCGDCCCKDREESMSDEDCPLHAPNSRHCCLEWLHYSMESLRHRERELWVPPLNRDMVKGSGLGTLILPGMAEPTPGITWGVVRRGFVASLRLPCEAFMRHAGAIFAAAPITAVALVDKEPERRNGRLWAWFCETTGGPGVPYQEQLPEPLWLLSGGVCDDVSYHSHPTRDAAMEAASDAAVALGRSAAGLPPLPKKGAVPCPTT